MRHEEHSRSRAVQVDELTRRASPAMQISAHTATDVIPASELCRGGHANVGGLESREGLTAGSHKVELGKVGYTCAVCGRCCSAGCASRRFYGPFLLGVDWGGWFNSGDGDVPLSMPWNTVRDLGKGQPSIGTADACDDKHLPAPDDGGVFSMPN